MKVDKIKKEQGATLKRIRQGKKIPARVVAEFFEKDITTIWRYERGCGLTPFVLKMYSTFLETYKKP